MTRTVLPPLLALMLLLTTSPVTLSQTPTKVTTDQDWQGLHDLKPGKRILVEYRDGLGDFDGKFVSAVGNKLTISTGGSDVTLERSDIQRVYRLKRNWSRSKTAKIGAGIGMAVGPVLGAWQTVELERRPGHVGSDRDTLPSVIGFFAGTVAGAGIGALLGGKRKGKLLYEAR